MDSTSYVSEAIRYQKIASDQFFQLMSYYQKNSEELLQNTLDQCAWLPGGSKESCLDWSVSCRETTKFLQEIVDSGFEQVEQIFVYPAKKDAGGKKSQPKQAAVPSQKTARQEKTSPAPKRKARTTAAKGAQKPAAAKDEASKSAPLKAIPPERGTAAPSKSISAAEKNVTPEAAPPQSVESKSNTQSSAEAGGAKSAATSSTPSTSSTSTS